MGTKLDFPALYFIYKNTQLSFIADHACLDCSFACHRMQEWYPVRSADRHDRCAAVLRQFPPVREKMAAGIDFRGAGAAQNRVVAEIFGFKAKLVEKLDMLNQNGVFIRM